MGNAAFALLWCFVFVVPWEEVVHLPGFGSVPRLVGVLACVVGVLSVVARGAIRLPSWFHLLAALFVVWAGVSGFWTLDPEATRVRFVTYLQLAVMVWLIWEMAWSPRRRGALLGAYVLGACVAAMATIHSYLSGVSLGAQATRFAGLNANPNDLGLTLVLGLPMAWYLSLSKPRRPTAWIWQLYFPLGITAILLTASRGAALAALVALLIVPWTLGRLRFRAKAALYALAVASVAFATRFVPEASLERIGSTRADIEAGHFGGRAVIWQSGLEVVREHPLVGVGAGAFGAAVAPILGGDAASHQAFLSILVEQGLVGLTLFLAMALAAVVSLPRLPTLERRFSIVILAALAVGGLSANWDYRKPLWFVLGVLAAQVGVARSSRAAQAAPARLAPGAVRSDGW
jgi:O-antigen ligase